MMPGQTYYTLVNNDDEEYELEDPITGYTEIAKYDSEEEAEEELEELIDEEVLNEEDGWHVERNIW